MPILKDVVPELDPQCDNAITVPPILTKPCLLSCSISSVTTVEEVSLSIVKGIPENITKLENLISMTFIFFQP